MDKDLLIRIIFSIVVIALFLWFMFGNYVVTIYEYLLVILLV